MNAKFEKWLCDEFDEWFCKDYKDETHNMWLTWQAALQSLEVTPELCRVAMMNYMIATPIAVDSRGVEAALTAVISALKEQAK